MSTTGAAVRIQAVWRGYAVKKLGLIEEGRHKRVRHAALEDALGDVGEANPAVEEDDGRDAIEYSENVEGVKLFTAAVSDAEKTCRRGVALEWFATHFIVMRTCAAQILYKEYSCRLTELHSDATHSYITLLTAMPYVLQSREATQRATLHSTEQHKFAVIIKTAQREVSLIRPRSQLSVVLFGAVAAEFLEDEAVSRYRVTALEIAMRDEAMLQWCGGAVVLIELGFEKLFEVEDSIREAADAAETDCYQTILNIAAFNRTLAVNGFTAFDQLVKYYSDREGELRARLVGSWGEGFCEITALERRRKNQIWLWRLEQDEVLSRPLVGSTEQRGFNSLCMVFVECCKGIEELRATSERDKANEAYLEQAILDSWETFSTLQLLEAKSRATALNTESLSFSSLTQLIRVQMSLTLPITPRFNLNQLSPPAGCGISVVKAKHATACMMVD